MGDVIKMGYREIKTEILRRIRSKTWPPGVLVPSEVELAHEFDCARATVNRALRELAEAGIVERKRKAGTRVCATPASNTTFEIPLTRIEVEASGATYRYVLVARKEQVAPDWLRARLGLPDDARVVHLECMHYADGSPFQFEDRWINIATVPHVVKTDFTHFGPNEWLVQEMPFSDAEFTFFATGVSSRLAEFLSLSTGDPVFTAERVTWISGQSVTFARMTFYQGYRMRSGAAF